MVFMSTSFIKTFFGRSGSYIRVEIFFSYSYILYIQSSESEVILIRNKIHMIFFKEGPTSLE